MTEYCDIPFAERSKYAEYVAEIQNAPKGKACKFTVPNGLTIKGLRLGIYGMCSRRNIEIVTRQLDNRTLAVWMKQ